MWCPGPLPDAGCCCVWPCCRLRVEHGVWGQIPVLLSLEKPRCKLVSLVDMENGNPLDYQVRIQHAQGGLHHLLSCHQAQSTIAD